MYVMCHVFSQLWLETPEGDTWSPSGIGLDEQVWMQKYVIALFDVDGAALGLM